MQDTNGHIICYPCVHTFNTEKTQDDFSVYMEYAHEKDELILILDRRTIYTHKHTLTHWKNGKVSEYTQAYTRIGTLPGYMHTCMR